MLGRNRAIAIGGLAVLFGCDASSASHSYVNLEEGRKCLVNISTSQGYGSDAKQMNSLVHKARTLAGKRVIPVEISAGQRAASSFLFLGADEEGFFLMATQEPGDVEPVILNQPSYFLKFPFASGTSWQANYKMIFNPGRDEIPMTMKIEETDAIVTVPAGTFSNCIKVHGTGFVGPSDRPTLSAETWEWSCPDVGSVRSISKEKGFFQGGGGQVTIDLVECVK